MIQVLVQAEAGSFERSVYDERTLAYIGTRRVSRPHPYPYGFVVGTSAADGESVDCYLVTTDRLKSGTIVECEPVGLLVQYEDGEVDHKVLAAIPGQDVTLGQELFQEFQDFIYATFADCPDVQVRVGPILPREAALHHLHESRSA
jgi:inorganic pyrophosphatase